MERAGVRFAIIEVWHLSLHRGVKADGLLEDGDPLRKRHHLAHVVRIVFWSVAREREADRAIVNTHLVANFAAEQLVNGQTGSLAGQVPQSHFNGADRRSPWLEPPTLPDLEHDPLDESGILADQRLAQSKDVRLQVMFPCLGLGIARDTFVRDDPHDW